ncbi:MAG: FHA domain-containing protein [Gemmatales bacterium]|nr:FHA domain-containing protein [Gemmatales bacterium]MDW8387378.1 FHA domain-containing protein [Gemmatales bacterium]
MVKCPYCSFMNEDGALYCDQCKSDLAVPADLPQASPLTEPIAVAAPISGSGASTAPATSPEPVAATEPIIPLAEPFAPPPPAAPAEAPAPAAEAKPGALPPDAKPKLVVIRGLKIGAEYPIYEGENFIGRADEKPVDIDLEEQESPDRIWSSRQHACIIFQEGVLTIEDLNSSNGTFVNRQRVYPGQKRQLNPNDVIQIGTVQLKVRV